MPTGVEMVRGGRETRPTGCPEEGTLEALGSVTNPPGTTKRDGMIASLSRTCTAIRGGDLPSRRVQRSPSSGSMTRLPAWIVEAWYVLQARLRFARSLGESLTRFHGRVGAPQLPLRRMPKRW